MMTNEGSTKIVIFMNPGAAVLVLGRGLIIHIVKMRYFFKIFLLPTLRHRFRQTKYIHALMMIKEGFSEIVNFMTPNTWALVLRHGHMSCNGNALFF